MNKWYESQDVDNVIISNRIRLARNIEGYKFPNKMDEYESRALISQMKLTVSKMKEYDLKCMDLADLSSLEKRRLIEHHAMSWYMLKQKLPGMVIMNNQETLSIMVNEEDHLRIQGIGTGKNILDTWDNINKLDDNIEDNVSYAFSEKYGYMTACPTNLGTGLRASYMLHLPILKKSKYLDDLLVSAGKIGMSIRGMYGEGTKSIGSIYQISNQKTLGRSETEIIEEVNNIAMHIVEQEKNIRSIITKDSRNKLKDSLYRSYGILAYARELSLVETMNLLSDVKLGFELEIYDMPKPSKNIYEIMIGIQEATISIIAEKENIKLPNNVIRANIIREYLKSNNN